MKRREISVFKNKEFTLRGVQWRRCEAMASVFSVAAAIGLFAAPVSRLSAQTVPNQASPQKAINEAVKEATPITATIDASHSYQRIDGFGAAAAYYQNWIAAHPNKTALYKTLFGGLNLSILRLQNGYRPDKKTDFAKDDADIVRGARKAQQGHTVRLLMSSWSPPAALKSNRDEKNGGTLAQENGAFVYDKFAGYWADSLVAYRQVGIVPTWISIQNEPDWKASWETCLLHPHEEVGTDGVFYAGYDRALEAVSRSIQAIPNTPLIVGPETLGIGGAKVQSYLGAKDAKPAKQVQAISYHLYFGGDHQAPDTFIPNLRSIRDAYPNKPILMTEFGRSDGFQTAWCVHNVLIEGNAAGYIYWAGMWPGPDALITIDNPFVAQSTWKLPSGFQPTDRYYGLKHFSYFVSPGYRRVDASASNSALKVSAFLSPDRSRLVAVALNTSASLPASLSLKVQGFTAETSAVYRSVLPEPAVTPTEGERVGVNGAGERFRALGILPAQGKSLFLPPQSIVTVVWKKQSQTGAKSP